MRFISIRMMLDAETIRPQNIPLKKKDVKRKIKPSSETPAPSQFNLKKTSPKFHH